MYIHTFVRTYAHIHTCMAYVETEAQSGFANLWASQYNAWCSKFLKNLTVTDACSGLTVVIHKDLS